MSSASEQEVHVHSFREQTKFERAPIWSFHCTELQLETTRTICSHSPCQTPAMLTDPPPWQDASFIASIDLSFRPSRNILRTRRKLANCLTNLNRRKQSKRWQCYSKITSDAIARLIDVERLRVQWKPKFHLFGKLPFELRRMIWQLVLPRKRVLAIEEKARAAPPADYQYQRDWQLFSSAQTPTLLHVCREARLEALRFYKLMFKKPLSPFRVSARHGLVTPFYMDTTFDTLFLTTLRCLFAFLFDINSPVAQELAITSISITEEACEDLALHLRAVPETLRKLKGKVLLPSLKTIIRILAQNFPTPIKEIEIIEFQERLRTFMDEQECIEDFSAAKLTCGHIVRAFNKLAAIRRTGKSLPCHLGKSTEYLMCKDLLLSLRRRQEMGWTYIIKEATVLLQSRSSTSVFSRWLE